MKQALWFLFMLIFLLSFSSLFAQSLMETSQKDESGTNQKVQKVNEIRKVVVTRNLVQMKNQNLEKIETVKYDEKGGIIIPNASKGIKMTSQNSKNVAELKRAKGKSKVQKTTQQKPLKAQKDRSQAVRAVEKKSQ